MINYTIKRIFEVIPVLLIVSIIVFSVMHLLPGDPTLLMLAGAEGGSIPQERLDELRIIMGLNKPLYEQYYNFISNAISGDLGTSIRLRTPVTKISIYNKVEFIRINDRNIFRCYNWVSSSFI